MEFILKNCYHQPLLVVTFGKPDQKRDYMFDEQSFSLTPVNFFSIGCDCKKIVNRNSALSPFVHRLPDTSDLCQEYLFAEVAMGWHPEGLAFCIDVDQAYRQSVYPNIQKGDSVELMIDTRDLKSAGFNTRFCHHFFFLPKIVDDHLCGEITHFRTEDQHPLCDPQELDCQTKFSARSYKMNIFIPANCIYGFEPNQFDRLGFTYRINRFGGAPQHFSVTSQDFQVDQQPSLWASVKLAP